MSLQLPSAQSMSWVAMNLLPLLPAAAADLISETGVAENQNSSDLGSRKSRAISWKRLRRKFFLVIYFCALSLQWMPAVTRRFERDDIQNLVHTFDMLSLGYDRQSRGWLWWSALGKNDVNTRIFVFPEHDDNDAIGADESIKDVHVEKEFNVCAAVNRMLMRMVRTSWQVMTSDGEDKLAGRQLRCFHSQSIAPRCQLRSPEASHSPDRRPAAPPW